VPPSGGIAEPYSFGDGAASGVDDARRRAARRLHHQPRGPVIVNVASRKGRQVLNDAGGYSVRHPLFSEVEPNEAQPG